nr:MAG TPA: hypothetical protein [Inoviridae sp.]
MAARRMAAALPSLPPARMAARRMAAALPSLPPARMAAHAFLKAKGVAAKRKKFKTRPNVAVVCCPAVKDALKRLSVSGRLLQPGSHGGAGTSPRSLR